MRRHRLYQPGPPRGVLAAAVALLAVLALLVLSGCEAARQDGDMTGPLFGKVKPCQPWPECNDGGGDDGGANKGDTLTVKLLDGMVTPVGSPQEVEVTFTNKRYFRIQTGPGIHTFLTETNLDDTQALAEDVNGPCFTDPPEADPLIIETLRARLVDPPWKRGFTMVVDKRGLDVTGTSVSFQNRLYTSWREPAFGLEDTPIYLQLWPEPFGDVTVVLDGGSFDSIAEGVDLTFLGGTLRAWTPDPQEFPLSAVTLYCPNDDEFTVQVRAP